MAWSNNLAGLIADLGIAKVRDTLDKLPPYSPDFNPVENAFAKLKALMRARAERTVSALWDAASSIVELFTPIECAKDFRAAGYEPDKPDTL